MFPSCVPPANNISFKRNRKNLPALSPLPLSLVLCYHAKKKPPLATQCNQDTRVYNSFLYGSGSGNGGKQTCELSVNHIKQQATIMCFLSPFSGGGVCTWRRGQKPLTTLLFNSRFTASAAETVSNVRFCRSSCKLMQRLSSQMIFLITTSCQDKNVCGCGCQGKG